MPGSGSGSGPQSGREGLTRWASTCPAPPSASLRHAAAAAPPPRDRLRGRRLSVGRQPPSPPSRFAHLRTGRHRIRHRHHDDLPLRQRGSRAPGRSRAGIDRCGADRVAAGYLILGSPGDRPIAADRPACSGNHTRRNERPGHRRPVRPDVGPTGPTGPTGPARRCPRHPCGPRTRHHRRPRRGRHPVLSRQRLPRCRRRRPYLAPGRGRPPP